MSEQEKCCCSSSCCQTIVMPPYTTGRVGTPSGDVYVADTRLSGADKWGSFKVRLDIGRGNYTVEPGLYGVGNPDAASPVLVTANYKLTFDALRRELSGIDAWILALDTKGVNVWCAAGKGTFGTDELMHRVDKTGLAGIVSHKTLILPQLGAPGVAAHEVQKHTGFHVVYGPVRAHDIPAFLGAGLAATPEMREVRFGFWDRLLLTPVELAQLAKPALYVLGTLLAAWLLGIAKVSWPGILPYIGAAVMGCVVTPALLSWIPGRAFSWKGWLVGAVYTALLVWLTAADWRQAVIWAAILPPASGFLAFNFTGSSTYTSRSGVVKEAKIALPVFIISAAVGLVFALLHTIIGF